MKRRIFEWWHIGWDCFNLKGGSIVGLYTLAIIALSCWATLTGKDIPSGVVTSYGLVIGAYAANKTVSSFKGKSNE